MPASFRQMMERIEARLGYNPYPHTYEELDAQHWHEITESRYYDLMNALPPRVYAGNCFVVGEELCHLNDDTPVWTTCAAVDGRYFTKPNTLARFRASDHAAEIRKQIKETVEL